MHRMFPPRKDPNRYDKWDYALMILFLLGLTVVVLDLLGH